MLCVDCFFTGELFFELREPDVGGGYATCFEEADLLRVALGLCSCERCMAAIDSSLWETVRSTSWDWRT